MATGSSAPNRPPPDDGYVRTGPLIGLAELVREHGFDPVPIFADMGLDIDQFADPDNEISYVGASRLLARCVSATGCGHLGLLLGQRAEASTLGIPGLLLQTAPDVRSAQRDLV